MGELVDDPRDEQYFRERILNAQEPRYARDEDTTVRIEFGDDGDYSVKFTRSEVIVYSECCARTPSLLEAREIYNALGAWLKIQDEKEK